MSTPRFADLSVRALDICGPDTASEPLFFQLMLDRRPDAASPPVWPEWKPGQFAMLRPAGWALDMPWARPLSICQVTEDTLVFSFQIAGRGTQRMSTLRPGDRMHIWGPLGTGFAVRPTAPSLLLAGGIGLAPFVGYAHAHPAPHTLRVMFGHRAPTACYPFDSFSPDTCCEDYPEKTLADRDVFLTAVTQAINDTAAADGLVLACGPTPFLRHVRTQALACGVATQLSLETRMACGVGACLGCVVTPTAANPVAGADALPVRTCVNGPVFWADHIELD